MTPRHPFLHRAARTALAAVLALGATAAAATDLAVGDAAPEFALEGSDGKVHRLADYRGRTVVLAWFPKAFTGG
jgi:peroxiredoxin Q/BCP